MENKDYPSPMYVTPQCCEKAKNTAAVFLSIDIYSDEQKPKWVTRTHYTKYQSTSIREAYFCPFCSTAVPEIVPSGETKPICSVTDGGYYCDTCKERLNCCTCLPPELAWRPKT